MTVVYGAVMSLIIASRFGLFGLAVWAAVWCVIAYRTSSRRSSSGQQPIGERSFDEC